MKLLGVGTKPFAEFQGTVNVVGWSLGMKPLGFQRCQGTVNPLGIHVVTQPLVHLSHEDLKALLDGRGQGGHLTEGARAVPSLSAPWVRSCNGGIDLIS